MQFFWPPRHHFGIYIFPIINSLHGGGELRRGLCTNPGWTRWWRVHDGCFPRELPNLKSTTFMQTDLEVEVLRLKKISGCFRCFRIGLESRNWMESSYNSSNLFGETQRDQRSGSLFCKMTTYDRFAVLLTREKPGDALWFHPFSSCFTARGDGDLCTNGLN